MSDKPQLKTSTGPFANIIILGHIDAASYDTEAGKVGACVEEADFNVIYRDTLPAIHDAASPVIEKMSAIPRGTNTSATEKAQERENKAAAAAKVPREPKKVKDVPETFVTYADRVKASVSAEIWATIDAKFREIALATPVDATPNVRSSGASKANLEKADDILSRETDKIEAAVSKMLALVPDFDLVRDEEGKPERSSLAKMVGAYIAASTASV